MIETWTSLENTKWISLRVETSRIQFKTQKRNAEKEAKKEAFRKYLESSGVVDALTKVLVALYEQNNKPSSAIEFVQQKLGGPSLSEYEKLKAEMAELQAKYNELQAAHEETCRQLEQYKSSTIANSEETMNDKPQPQRSSHEGAAEEPLH